MTMRNWITILQENQEPLTEIFKDPGNLNWTQRSDSDWDGEFTVAGTPFEINIFRSLYVENGSIWLCSFQVNEEWLTAKLHDGDPDTQIDIYGNTGLNGNTSVQVFGIVIYAMREFLRAVAPQRLQFTADKRLGKDKLYGRMIQRFIPELRQMGYEVEVGPDRNGSRFTLVRKGRVNG